MATKNNIIISVLNLLSDISSTENLFNVSFTLGLIGVGIFTIFETKPIKNLRNKIAGDNVYTDKILFFLIFSIIIYSILKIILSKSFLNFFRNGNKNTNDIEDRDNLEEWLSKKLTKYTKPLSEEKFKEEILNNTVNQQEYKDNLMKQKKDINEQIKKIEDTLSKLPEQDSTEVKDELKYKLNLLLYQDNLLTDNINNIN